MEITSLIDHVKTTTGTAITTEWGLSLHLKCNEFSMLFDMGSSGHFIDNAAALGIDIQSVDPDVLSHGHFDHGGGLRSLLVANSKAVVHMRRGADADLYAKLFGFKRYVGLEKEVLSLYKDRIRFLDQSTELREGVFAIILAKESYPPPKGNRFLFRRRGSALSLDDFSHELALAVEADGGIVVFTGCSHHGTLNILAAVKDALPDRPIKILFGGSTWSACHYRGPCPRTKNLCGRSVRRCCSLGYKNSIRPTARDRKAIGFSRTSWVRGWSTFPPDRGFASNVVEKEDIKPCRA